MWRRNAKTPTAPLGSTKIIPDPQPLTAENLESFYAAADQRRSGTVPSIYDLVACCEALEKRCPIEARTTKRQLRWLMRACRDYLGTEWGSPL